MSTGEAIKLRKAVNFFHTDFHIVGSCAFLQRERVVHFVVRNAILPAAEDDANPFERERPHSGVMGFIPISLLVIERSGPGRFLRRHPGPFMKCLPQELGSKRMLKYSACRYESRASFRLKEQINRLRNERGKHNNRERERFRAAGKARGKCTLANQADDSEDNFAAMEYAIVCTILILKIDWTTTVSRIDMHIHREQ